MKGFGLLLTLTLAVVALAICGPPAIAGHSDYLTSQDSIASGPVTVVESPAAAPALLPVVADPGSCGSQFAQFVDTQSKFTDNASHAADHQRWRCRLLIRLPCG